MVTETNVVLVLGEAPETELVLEAANKEGWSAQHIKSLEDVPPREQIDPEIVMVCSDQNWASMTEEQRHHLGKRVIWMVPEGAWSKLSLEGLAGVISAKASVDEIHYRMVSTVREMNQQLLSRLGLAQNQQGEALWDMLPSTDWVTGLPNRISYLQEVRKQISRSTRYQRPFCCLLVQLDNYKTLEGGLSNEVMEEFLSDIAGWLEMCVRDSDTLARLQSDTFGMVLPETDVENAQVVVNRIREYLGNFQFSHPMPESLAFSVGVSAFQGETMSLDSLLSQAQEDLHAPAQGATDPS